MKQIVNYRHASGSDFGSFERDGQTQNYDNIVFLCIDDSDTEWYAGRPTLEKVPFELVIKATSGITADTLDQLIGRKILIEKESKLVNRNGVASLSEKVTGVYIIA